MIVLPPQIDEWCSLFDLEPPAGVLCRFEQRYNSGLITRWTGTLEEFRPDFNLEGIRWKLTGIGWHQLESRRIRGENIVTMFIPPRGLDRVLSNVLRGQAQNCPISAWKEDADAQA